MTRMKQVATVPVDPARAQVYAEGWQSWSVTGVFPVTDPPPPVTWPDSLAIDCQYRGPRGRPGGRRPGHRVRRDGGAARRRPGHPGGAPRLGPGHIGRRAGDRTGGLRPWRPPSRAGAVGRRLFFRCRAAARAGDAARVVLVVPVLL